MNMRQPVVDRNVRAAAIVFAALTLAIVLPNLLPDRASNARIAGLVWVCLTSTPLLLVFLGRGRFRALKWIGLALSLLLFALAVLR
jgi:hypothetical protein